MYFQWVIAPAHTTENSVQALWNIFDNQILSGGL